MLYFINAVLTTILVISSVDATRSRFRDCGAYNPQTQMKVPKMALPATLYVGRKNIVDVDVNVTGQISPSDVVSMKVKKATPFGLMEAPCVLNIGSCTLPLKEWFKKAGDISCQLMTQFGLPCKPDIKEGRYAKKAQIFVSKDLIPELFRVMIPGDYSIEIRLYDSTKRIQKGCFQLDLNMNV